MDPNYTIADAGCPNRLRGTNQQTNTALLWTPPSGSLGSPTTTLIEGLAIGYAGLHNRSGATAAVGVGARQPNRLWIAGQWTNAAATPYVDNTAAAQSTTTTFALETTTNNDGYVVASLVPFNCITLNITTGSSGGGPNVTRAIRYSNAAGTNWTNLTSASAFVFDGASGSAMLAAGTGEALVVIAMPSDWGAIASGGLSGIPAGYYALNIRATGSVGPGGTPAVATGLEVWNLSVLTGALATNSTFEYAPNKGEIRLPYSNGAGALFGTANVGNRATVHLRTA